MFGETSYPHAAGLGALGFIGDDPLWSQLGFGSKTAWKQAGRPNAAGQPTGGGSIGPTGQPPIVTTIPTTEPNQCPPGMTYAAPPPGSGTGTCSGSIIPGNGGGSSSGGSSITDLISSIPSTYLLIGGAILLFVLLKK